MKNYVTFESDAIFENNAITSLESDTFNAINLTFYTYQTSMNDKRKLQRQHGDSFGDTVFDDAAFRDEW